MQTITMDVLCQKCQSTTIQQELDYINVILKILLHDLYSFSIVNLNVIYAIISTLLDLIEIF